MYWQRSSIVIDVSWTFSPLLNILFLENIEKPYYRIKLLKTLAFSTEKE